MTAIGEEVKPLFGEPYIKCKPSEFAELQKAVQGSFARQIQAQATDKKVKELETKLSEMISPDVHDEEIRRVLRNGWNMIKTSEAEKEKFKKQADLSIMFIQGKGLGDEYQAWADMHSQRERLLERTRHPRMER